MDMKHTTKYLYWTWFEDTTATQLYSTICAMSAASCEVSPVAINLILVLTYKVMHHVMLKLRILSVCNVVGFQVEETWIEQ